MDFNAIILSLKSKKISNIVAGFYILEIERGLIQKHNQTLIFHSTQHQLLFFSKYLNYVTQLEKKHDTARNI